MQYYNFQLADNNTFQKPIVDDSTLTDTVMHVDPLRNNIRYYCRLRTKVGSLWGDFGISVDFLTQMDPGTDVLLNDRCSPEFDLYQNFPNPFNLNTTIAYYLSAKSMVSLTVLNTLGETVCQLTRGDEDPGYHKVQLDGSRFATGLYFYRLNVNGCVTTKKLILIK